MKSCFSISNVIFFWYIFPTITDYVGAKTGHTSKCSKIESTVFYSVISMRECIPKARHPEDNLKNLVL